MQRVCIATNSATSGYAITGTGSGLNGAFALADASGQTMPLNLAWDGQTLIPGQPLSASSQGCGGGQGGAALGLATVGPVGAAAWSGAVTLTLAPL